MTFNASVATVSITSSQLTKLLESSQQLYKAIDLRYSNSNRNFGDSLTQAVLSISACNRDFMQASIQCYTY